MANCFYNASQVVFFCVFFLENVFPPYFWGSFWQYWENKVEKLEVIMKKQVTLEKNYFHPSKKHLQQCWRAQNILEVAGCLVYASIQNKSFENDGFPSNCLRLLVGRGMALVRRIHPEIQQPRVTLACLRRDRTFSWQTSFCDKSGGSEVCFNSISALNQKQGIESFLRVVLRVPSTR